MKLSEAILKGMERFPVALVGMTQSGNSACVMGCANWGFNGDAHNWDIEDAGCVKFLESYGVTLVEANDVGLLREEIVGMLQAIGE